MSVNLTVNGAIKVVNAPLEMPLLWALRDELGLLGTKLGCGVGACGACTVLVNGQATRSCVFTLDNVGTQSVRTIEGLANPDGRLHPLQQAWIEEQVPQCGYCQSGMLMAAVALLEQYPDPSDEQINMVMTNLCRCGTYERVRKAIHNAAQVMQNHALLSQEATP
jgi:isoquinoline 1-oxidoreductase subunit alpha